MTRKIIFLINPVSGTAKKEALEQLITQRMSVQNIAYEILHSNAAGNYEFLKAYAENNLTSGGFIWGMRYSVWCREEMPFQSRRKINDQVKSHPALKGFRIQGALPEICKIWNVPPAPAIENQPVKSNIPALIFSGEFDPDTPPAWGRLVASWFPNSFFYEVKNTSHGAMNNRCTFAEIPSSFLRNPTSKPDSTCLSTAKPIDYK
jgi:pimeloyl-ACP methyl ester carboxylesterase